MDISLSRHEFLNGTQCHKKIYLSKFKPAFKNRNEIFHPETIQRNQNLKLLFFKLNQDGIDLSEGGKISGKDLACATLRALKDERENYIYYNPGFYSDKRWYINVDEKKSESHIFYNTNFHSNKELFYKADLLIKGNKKWNIYIVKGSTEIKIPSHIYDIGFLQRILKLNNFPKCVDIYIVHINNEYILKKNTIELEDLFTVQKVTQKSKDIQPLIDRMFLQTDRAIKNGKAPAVKVGRHCFNPYECEFTHYCWRTESPTSIHNIGLSEAKIEKLLEDGITDVKNIEENVKLSRKQFARLQAILQGKPQINYFKIAKFINSINPDGPLLFMDFESIMPYLPLVNGGRPYQQYPVQYCVLSKSNPEAEIVRRDFFAEPGTDPRKNFIENLLKDTEDKGNIIVYNKHFEIKRLKELASAFPEYESAIDERISRIIDLMIPFQEQHYLHSEFRGKFSLKVVAGIMCPETSYKNLKIKNGEMAMSKYESLLFLPLNEQLEGKRDLIQYCYTDTMVMVKILEKLKEIVAGKPQESDINKIVKSERRKRMVN